MKEHQRNSIIRPSDLAGYGEIPADVALHLHRMGCELLERHVGSLSEDRSEWIQCQLVSPAATCRGKPFSQS